MAQAWLSPARTASTLASAAPCSAFTSCGVPVWPMAALPLPIWPDCLLPQQETVASLVMAKVSYPRLR